MTLLNAVRCLSAATMAVLFLTAPAAADPPAQLDALTEKTLERWAELEYRPARAGLTGGSVVLNFKGRSRGRSLNGEATYAWDSSEKEPTSTLDWEPARLGRQLVTEGWSQDALDQLLLVSDDLADYRGCSLTAARSGDQVVVSVDGSAKNGVRRMTFDSAGLLVKTEYDMKEGGRDLQFSVESTYRKHADKFVKAKEVFRMNMGGEVVSTTTYDYTEVDGVLVPSEVKETSTWNGRPSGSKTITWTEWEIRK